MIENLRAYLEKNRKKVLIWDFDEVIYTLDWFSREPLSSFIERIYNSIQQIDLNIIKNKEEFISRAFPYPEINTISEVYGEKKRILPIEVMKKKELANLDLARANNEAIDFIKNTSKEYIHAIWSNNTKITIEKLLHKSELADYISEISALDSTKYSKPNIVGFQYLLNSIGEFRKSKMLMIGDSLRSDKVAAENANIDFFHFKE